MHGTMLPQACMLHLVQTIVWLPASAVKQGGTQEQMSPGEGEM